MPYTYGQLVMMATAHEKSAWNHTSSIVATLCNANRAKGKAAVKPEDIHPYKSSKDGSNSKGIPLTKDNISVLKAFARQ